MIARVELMKEQRRGKGTGEGKGEWVPRGVKKGAGVKERVRGLDSKRLPSEWHAEPAEQATYGCKSGINDETAICRNDTLTYRNRR